MDNLGVRKGGGICSAIEAIGAALVYFPPYSLDYSPIKPCWSKPKGVLVRPLRPECVKRLMTHWCMPSTSSLPLPLTHEAGSSIAAVPFTKPKSTIK
jgi:transposase